MSGHGPLVVTPCGGRKVAHRAKARDLYTGPYFSACLNYALALTTFDRVRILSAKYGLVPLDLELDPYDLRMGQRGCVTPEQVRKQAREQGIADERNVVVLGGKAYTAVAKVVWPHADTPLANVQGGMGYQLAALTRWTREAQGIPTLLGGW